ncbi:MAG TPA: NUDIX domain-containing protein, partial [Anaerolineae bacterium]
YSHFRITLHAFHCRYLRGRPQAIGCAAFKWVTLRALSKYAFPAANRRVIEQLIAEGGRQVHW